MDEQLKALLDYTKFHIGMYTTMVGAILAAFTSESLGQQIIHFAPLAWICVLCFFLAGVFGGLVGASIPHSATLAAFLDKELGPWGLEFLKAKTCIYLEHTFFWVGSLYIVIALSFHGYGLWQAAAS